MRKRDAFTTVCGNVQLKMNGSRCRVAASFFVARIARGVRQLQEHLGGLPAIDEKTPGVHVPLRVPDAGGSPSFQRKDF
ncbi:hypothetical protein P8818_16505 [Bacillus velezensis]|nr:MULTISPECIES: hypothetical protein [Bacillus]AYC54119.1 hypothetical protein C7M53_23015 [Bacillus licheniformis]MEC0383767.1 hypothetical protein [Bacillus velezensis]MEC0389154.1 hypothetical protein [Bacillus velezensis]NWN81147.1 hypothetical protein [Bacillus sp. (in: firmicutes)]WBY47959.1 hypothetical protein PF996_21680 [Bacillus velezensis]